MKERISIIAACVIMTILSFPLSSPAIYQWVDKKGHLHITDYPPPFPQPAEKEEKAAPDRLVEMTEPVPNEPVITEPTPEPQMKTTEQVQPQPAPQTPAQPPAGVQVKQPIQPPPTPAPAQQPVPQSGKVVIPFTGKGTTQTAPVVPVPQAPGSLPAGFDPKMLEQGPSREMVAAMLSGVAPIFAVFIIGLYIFTSLCMHLIAKKVNVPAAWLAWVPILQIWPFFRSAGKSLLWIIPCLIPFVNVIVGVYLWMCIAENVGKNKWLGLLTLIPIANLLLMAILAFSKKEGAEAPSPAVA